MTNSTARDDAGWRPIETAPRDRTRILAITGEIADERFSHWSHREFVVFHLGYANKTGMDLGWALFPGFNCCDDWLAAWQPLPTAAAPLEQNEALRKRIRAAINDAMSFGEVGLTIKVEQATTSVLATLKAQEGTDNGK